MAMNRRFMVGLVAFLLGAATSSAQQPHQDDVLPAGAVARLGSTRLHHAGVIQFVFAPDGKRLASIGRDGPFHGKVQVWDVKTGNLLRTFRTGKLGPSLWAPLVFAPDGRCLLAGLERSLCVWDVERDRQLFERDFARIISAAFAPDSKSLAVVAGDRVIVLEAASGTQRHELEGCKYMQQAAFSRDGATLTAIGHEKPDRKATSIYSWATATGKKINDRFLEFPRPFATRLSPDGGHVMMQDSKRSIHVWRTATGEKLAQAREDGYPARAAWFPDGRRVVARDNDGKLEIWDPTTGKLLRRLQATDAVRKVALADDDALAATVDNDDDTLRLWDLATGKELHPARGERGGRRIAVFAPDGKSIILASYDNRQRVPTGPGFWSLRRWDFGAGRETDIKPRIKTPVEVRRAALAPAARWLALADGAGELTIVDAATGKQVGAGKLPVQTATVKIGEKVVQHMNSYVGPLAFAPDGRTIAVPSRGKIGLFETATAKLLRELPRPAEAYANCCFFPDSRSLLISEGAVGAVLCRIDAASGAELANFAGAKGLSYALAISSKGDAIARSGNKLIEMIDASTGDPRWSAAVDDPPFTLAFSPDGGVLATGGRDGVVRLWNAASGAPVEAWRGHNAEVASLAFSRDGRLLVSCGGSVVLVWRVPARDNK